MQTASNELLGIDVELWVAGAAFFGPIVAALVGVVLFRFRQRVEDVDRRFIRDGIESFHTNLSGLLSAHLLNFQIATYILRYLKTYRRGELLTPPGSSLPRFIGVERDSLPISPLLPMQELIGDKVILDWGMLALSDTTLEAKELDFQIRQPIVAYYDSDPSAGTLDVDEVVERLTKVTDAWNGRIEKHFALLDRLHELDREVARKRPWRVSGYYALRNRSQVIAIRQCLKEGHEEMLKARKRVEPVLKSGGVEPPADQDTVTPTS